MKPKHPSELTNTIFPKLDWERVYHNAKAAHSSKNYEEAIKNINYLREHFPEHLSAKQQFELLKMLSTAYHEIGKPEDAQKYQLQSKRLRNVA